MNKNFPDELFPNDSLLSLLRVLDEPLFCWLLREEEKPQKRFSIPKIRSPWELVQKLSLLLEIGVPYLETEHEEILPSVWVARGVRIHGTATIIGPIVLCEGVEVREMVFLRGPLYLGRGIRLEREAHIQSSILCEGVRVGASSTVLDSIVGKEVVLEDRVTTLTRGNEACSLSVEYPPGVFHPTGCHRLGSFICPRARVRRGVSLKSGSFIPPGSLV